MADSEAAPAEIPMPSVAVDDTWRQRVLLARIAVIGTFLAVWQGAVSFGLIDSFWVSSPVLVSKELWQEILSGDLIRNVGITVFEALIAFVVSSALGIAAGLMLARSPFWDEVLAPLVLALNSLPRVALAPLIILWFGIGIVAKVVTAFTLGVLYSPGEHARRRQERRHRHSHHRAADGRVAPRHSVESDAALGAAVDFRQASISA